MTLLVMFFDSNKEFFKAPLKLRNC